MHPAARIERRMGTCGRVLLFMRTNGSMDSGERRSLMRAHVAESAVDSPFCEDTTGRIS
jgi:hypothetical protein